MKKIKTHAAKLQLNKKTITNLTRNEKERIQGGAIPTWSVDPLGGCFSVSECASRWCDDEPMPPIGNTGCIDCTVCPRTF
ncbi:class I lanthipeptide [Taibaiella helva]|uniref:class I lanthipeptide n=1 Tax=Taibaiella helva TaxID=2301235 RepID=UPI000E57794D|nr:class I lanthipeptide [Taibaiella helva]